MPINWAGLSSGKNIPMYFSEEQINEIYRLAGLDPSADEKQRMLKDIEKIMVLTKPMTVAPEEEDNPLISPRNTGGVLRDDEPEETVRYADKKISSREGASYFVVERDRKKAAEK